MPFLALLLLLLLLGCLFSRPRRHPHAASHKLHHLGQRLGLGGRIVGQTAAHAQRTVHAIGLGLQARLVRHRLAQRVLVALAVRPVAQPVGQRPRICQSGRRRCGRSVERLAAAPL